MRAASTFLLLFYFLFHTNGFGQSTSEAMAQASIIQTINIINVRDMNFGNISAGPAPGTVVLDPTEAGNRTATGGVTLPSGSSTVNSAKFVISGADGFTFSIILPSSPVTLSNGTSTLTIDNFTSTPSGTGTFNAGAQTLCIGATINVSAYQEPGVYISTEDIEITINYY